MWERLKAYFAKFDNGRDEAFEAWWQQHPNLSHTNAVWLYQQEGHRYDFRNDRFA